MDLTHLGKQSSQPVERVECVPWDAGPVRVRFDCSEFTSHCPVTGQPDFAVLTIEYIPSDRLIETKSLKLYLWKFRDERAFNERLVARIAADLHEQSGARALSVVGRFNARGGIAVTATAVRGDADLLA